MSPDAVDLPKAEPPQSVFRFERIGITKFSMEETVGSPAPSLDDALDEGVHFEIQARISHIPANSADVWLNIKIAPGPNSKPYTIALELVGTFSIAAEVPREVLIRFCQTNALAILFPYVRQAINEVTSNGRYGPLRLPLLNLQALLQEGAWHENLPLQPQEP